ncbi:uncharacterized protein KY384_003652 [Bacidia gigantensis]|uniref:uncharacterized protein n=1 Tax=Bacidia gigantensis TaxID=2732470 RepID=UPI001D03D690|nr:uncharacterized protein KY384_003652 [Bacidia gigantensis]KAG8532016.1 hypothetical protein KY384_003652 [Bacidia gigantensis]
MAAVTQRHKAAKYGKAHRKALVDAAFGGLDELSQTPWDTACYSNIQRTDQEATPQNNAAIPNHPLRSSNHHHHHTSRSSSTSSQSREDELYGSPPSDDEVQKKQSVAIRKRRKLSPPAEAKQNAPLRFDDAGKQKAKAKQMLQKGKAHLSAPVASAETSLPSTTGQKTISEGQRRSKNVPIARKPTQKKLNSLSETVQKRYKVVAAPKITSKQARYSIRPREGSSSTSNERLRDSAAPQTPPPGLGDPPVTPPRSSPIPHGYSTTPRQQDLWDRLLASESQYASPSQLSMSGFDISDGAKASAQSCPKSSGPPSYKQCTSTRLIDALKSPQKRSRSQDSDSSTDSQFSAKSTASNFRPLIAEEQIPGVTDTVNFELAGGANNHVNGMGEHDLYLGETSIAQPIVPSRGLKVTYAQQRSYLTDQTESQKVSFDFSPQIAVPRPQQPQKYAPTGTASRSNSIDEYEFELDEPQNPQVGAMRSIHELREAGGSVRSVGELEALLDELDGSQDQVTVTRRILIAFATKFEEPSNSRLFVDKGFELRLFSKAVDIRDTIVMSLHAMSMLRLLLNCNSPTLRVFLTDKKIMPFLMQLLTSDQNLVVLAKQRETNLSKLAQQEYVALCNRLLAPVLWRKGRPTLVSCRLLSLQCLEHLYSLQIDQNPFAQPLTAENAQQLIETSIPKQSDLWASNQTQRVSVHLSVSILETYIIGGGAAIQALQTPEILDRIVQVLPSISAYHKDSEALQVQTLRLYLNMTNNVPGISEAFAHPDVVTTIFDFVTSYFTQAGEEDAENKLAKLDKGILSLGCLTNIAEVSEGMRCQFLRRTGEQPAMLDALMQLFLTNNRKASEVYSQEESISNVAFGYVSVLICYLCLSEPVRVQVPSLLPEKSLQTVFEAVAEFLEYHRMIDDKTGNNQNTDGRIGFVERVQGVLNDLGSR